MKQLSVSQKLHAISTVTLKSGMKLADFNDIRMWLEKTNGKSDTTMLDDKSVDRIDSLYYEYFYTT